MRRLGGRTARNAEPVDPATDSADGYAAGGFARHHLQRGHCKDNPDLQPGLRVAAASNAMAGRPEQAHQAVARLRQLNPALRVSTLRDVGGPYRRAEDISRYEEGLRQAGLPE